MDQSPRLLLKTRVFAALVIASNVLGNLSLSWGLRRVGRLLSLSPWPYVEALFNPWVAFGVSLLIIWLLAQMTLLSWADLSYVLPVTSAGYVLAALAGRFFLDEQITLARWAGILLIMAGVALVGRTHPRTTGPGAPPGAMR
jgi:drug/metabolite transporter (DMT)-like permease